jgi:transcription termination/antitermination protein NusG
VTTGQTPDESLEREEENAEQEDSGAVETVVEDTAEEPVVEETLEEVPSEEAKPSKDSAEPVTDTEEAASEDDEEAPEDDEESDDVLRITPDPDDGIKRRWYAVHAYSGQEANVKRHLVLQAEQENLSDLVGDILVPMEEVAEIKSGEKKISKRKFFPGYVLVRLPEHPERNAELWHLIKETPGVSGFIGSRTAPVPLDDGEVQAIVEEVRGEKVRPKPKVKFEEGERIKIIDGPFSNFLGSIGEVNAERGTLKVMVEIFERLTSVEVEFWQVEKT